MIKDKNFLVEFEKVIGTSRQIVILYELLNKRKYRISHGVMPSLNQHKKFVMNHPYRIWYLVKLKNNYIGSFYILKNNCIAISLLSKNDSVFSEIFYFIYNKYKPLKEIKSIRPPYFYINLSPTNQNFINYLERFGANIIQISYSIVLEKLIRKKNV